MSDDLAPIIVKKIKKGGHGYHGGAWKVAYADFVTAMMAFFLLLWLLNVTTSEQKQAIAYYFDPFSVSNSSSGSGGVMGGKSMIEPGASISSTTAPGLETALPTADATGDDRGNDASTDRDIMRDGGFSDLDGGEMMSQEEQQQFNQAAQQLFASLDDKDLLEGLKDNLIVEQTSEGLRIQIVDSKRRAMFAPGSAKPLPFVQEILASVTSAITDLPNKIDISGHTDASGLKSLSGKPYDNWDLSADRANEARRLMLADGLQEDRLSRVIGRAAADPLLPETPLAPGNRRISIVLLRPEKVPEPTAGGPGHIRRNDPNYRRIVPVPEAIVPLPSAADTGTNSTPIEDRLNP